MGVRGIIGVGICVVAAIWNLANDEIGDPRTAAIWLILAGVIVAGSRWLRGRKVERERVGSGGES